jgi:hypothetical protein
MALILVGLVIAVTKLAPNINKNEEVVFTLVLSFPLAHFP